MIHLIEDYLSNVSFWSLLIFLIVLLGILLYYSWLRGKEKAVEEHSEEVRAMGRERRKAVGITTLVFFIPLFLALVYADIPFDYWNPRRRFIYSYSKHSGVNLFYLLFFLYFGLTVIYTFVRRIAKERATSAFFATIGVLTILTVGGVYVFTNQQDRKAFVQQVKYYAEQRGRYKSKAEKQVSSSTSSEGEKSAFVRTGTLRFDDGMVYSGELVNGKPHGEGVLASPKGFRYKGEFRNGVPDGRGKLSMQDGSWEAEGVFCGTESVGVCTLYWHLPAGERRYVGEVENLEPHGKGKMYETDGAIYEGTFYHGQKHGSGVYTYTDGSTFKGIWENNKLIHKQQ